MIEKIIKISSLSGGILIFCGVSKLIFYYSAFGIDIVDFLSLSEIITSFLDDLHILLIFGVVMAVQSIPLLNSLENSIEKNSIIEDVYSDILKAIYGYRYYYIFGFVIIGLTTFLFTCKYGYNYPLIYILIFCMLQILTFLIIRIDKNGEIDISSPSIILMSMICAGSSIFLLARHDIDNVTKYNNPVSIITKDKTIECNKRTKNIFIGKTDGYVFIKDVKNNRSYSIPAQKVEQFIFY